MLKKACLSLLVFSTTLILPMTQRSLVKHVSMIESLKLSNSKREFTEYIVPAIWATNAAILCNNSYQNKRAERHRIESSKDMMKNSNFEAFVFSEDKMKNSAFCAYLSSGVSCTSPGIASLLICATFPFYDILEIYKPIMTVVCVAGNVAAAGITGKGLYEASLERNRLNHQINKVKVNLKLESEKDNEMLQEAKKQNRCK
ncbi:MAG: hypothetical protein Q8Q60_04540 [Candidatus Chromulinivorax sp.]|nr:hypothetical protein [Candidatus Chromulinivorax sp.]